MVDSSQDIYSQFGVSPNDYEYDPNSNTIRLKSNTFDERWNLPVQAPSDIVGNVPNMPTNIAPSNPNIYGLPIQFQKPLIEMPDNRLVNDYQVSPGVPALNKLFGTGNEERFQTWPERMAKSGVSLPADVYEGREPIVDDAGRTSEKVIERTQDLAGMAGMSGIGMTPKGALGTAGSRVEGFYSNLERTIANAKIEKATPEQWTSYLKNQSGIKNEELEFAGLDKLPSGQITKQQLAEHVAENGVKLGEVWKGTKNQDILVKKQEEIRDRLEKIQDEFDAAYGKPDSAELAKRRQELSNEKFNLMKENGEIFNQLEGNVNSNTKYSSYQLPDATNYRELLLTVPNTKLEKAGKALADFEAEFNGRPIPQEFKAKHDALRESIGNAKNETGQYTSSHWDEPNVLAHIRMNDRDIPGVGKSLHIEEVQSDWGQAGRKQGFNNPTAEENSIRERIKTNKATTEDYQAWENGVGDKFAKYEQGVPNMPFKKSWDELALKRALTEAVNNGYDALSWTPGEAQAARYDLSKQLNAVGVIKHDNGTFLLEGFLPNGGVHDFGNNVSKEKLADYVGKDLAEKISNQKDKHKEYSGIDLKIGGEGMKAFYDKMLVNTANKLVSKMGGKVEYENLPSKIKDQYKVVDGEGNTLKEFKDEGEARQYVAENPRTREIKTNGKQEIKGDRIPIIRITPQMREKIKSDGFPLFTAPVYVPVDNQPEFEPKLTAISHDPFKMTPVNHTPEF